MGLCSWLYCCHKNKVACMLDIPRNARVLEIGSGNRPRPQSTILCDRFLDDNYHRGGGQELVLDGRPFVVADGLALPFKDKAFDYVIASHVFEHVEDPQRFAAELMRIARAGYIETPSELSEKVFGWQFHRWILHVEGDRLYVRPRTEDSPFGRYFHDKYISDPAFAAFADAYFADFNVSYEWHDRINLVVETETDRAVRFNRYDRMLEVRPAWRVAGGRLLEGVLRHPLRLMRYFMKNA